MPTVRKHFLSAVVVAALMPVATMAQSYPNQGYWVDGLGEIVTSSTSGQCWHTREWTPALAVEPCDPVIKRMSEAPVEQVAQSEPAPVVVPPPVVVAPLAQRISFSSEALFAFDKSVLSAEGRTMLDDLSVQLRGVTYDTIEVTGHADRIGSAAYNQKLSERRAIAVKSYLAEKNIPADRISARGLGETQPVTQAGACRGPLSARLIACLQPDRRVDVEMKGMQSAAPAP